MKLCTFLRDGVPLVGVVTDDGIVDLSESAPELPAEMTALLAAGEPALRRAPASRSIRCGWRPRSSARPNFWPSG